MTTPSTTATSSPLVAQSPVQQAPSSTSAPDEAAVRTDGWTPAWTDRFSTVLWQLGLEPGIIARQVDQIRSEGLEEPQLEQVFAVLAREVALRHSSDAWESGVDMGAAWPDQGPIHQRPIDQGPIQQGPGTPPGLPPNVPAEPGRPAEPPVEPPVDPPPGSDPHDGGPTITPWLIGAGILGAGIAGAVAIRTGSRNVRALSATAASFNSGTMHQGGLQSIRDAQLGARFTGGIGPREYLSVALPGVNRLGSGAPLTSVARGHLDHTELLAASTALRRGTGDAVSVHEPMRRVVLDGLEGGRSMRSVLDDLDRSAAGARPVFDNPQLARYWDQGSVLERGRRVDGRQILSGASETRPKLALERVPVADDDAASVSRQIVETGGSTRINRIVAGRDADLAGRGLAEGIGTTQGINVSTLHPAMQQRAIQASGVDQTLVDAIGLQGAFTQRWVDRLGAAARGAGQ